MDIDRSPNNMTNNSTVGLCRNGCFCAVLCHNVLTLINIGSVHNSLILGGALFLIVASLFSVRCTLLLRHLTHHRVTLWDSMCGTLFFMFNNIVCYVLSMAHCLWHRMTCFGCYNFIGDMALWSISIWVSVSTTSSMAIIPTITRVCIGFRISCSFSLCIG